MSCLVSKFDRSVVFMDSIWPRELLVGLVVMLAGLPCDAQESPTANDFFEKRVRPVLVQHCYDCHGPDDAAARLRLDTRQGWERGGERGPAIVPGDPSASLLIRAISHRDAQLKMPPEDSGSKLTDQQIADLVTWIRQGAFDPRTGEVILTEIDLAARDHWAFQPLASPAIPAGVHPIDFLIDQKLAVQQFTPTPPADLQTLIRRTTFNLHGLPPTPAQLATPRKDFPQLVQALLASPRYGERWGRHWLDVARYSDAKDGVLMYGDARIRPFAYTYRDYVIQAFHDDKPFDQFVREQLAADQLGLAEGAPELAALGLLTLGRMFDSNRPDVIDDQIDVVSRGFLGLTVSCARCHDHKFDPVPTADYYSLYGVFASSIEPYQRPRIGEVTEAGTAFEAEFQAKLNEVLETQQKHYVLTLQTARERTADYLVAVVTTEPDVSETTVFFQSLIPEQLRPRILSRWRKLVARRAFPDDPLFGPWHDLQQNPQLQPETWRARGVDKRIIHAIVEAQPQTPADVARVYGEVLMAAWKEAVAASGLEDLVADSPDPLVALLLSRESPVWFPLEDLTYYLSRQPNDAYRGLLKQLDQIAVKHPAAAARAMVVQDTELLTDPVIFQRGDSNQPGNPVPRQFLEILSPEQRQPFTTGGGRLDLANAIADPANPLTPRVWVNRVWMHHFGEPLVETPGDFGLQTPQPVQLELLDFLASHFIQQGWRTKPLHELILTSQAYQRSSLLPRHPQMQKQLDADPNNQYWWRAQRRRLDLEQMRDSLLFVSRELDESMFGRPTAITNPNNRRRTVYAFVERQNIPDIVSTFDFANADTSTPRRVQTTVPQQALFAMNSRFMLDRSAALATLVERMLAEETESPPAAFSDDQGHLPDQLTREINSLYQLAYGRLPRPAELELARHFREAGSLSQLAQVLLMSNELMFVD